MRIEMDKIYCGDSLQVLQTLPENAVDCCVTSPPYYALRDYGADGQIGREATPEEYVSRITAVFHEVKRVLTPEGKQQFQIQRICSVFVREPGHDDFTKPGRCGCNCGDSGFGLYKGAAGFERRI